MAGLEEGVSRAGEWARAGERSRIYPISSEPVGEAARLLSSAPTTSWTRKQSVEVHRLEEVEEGLACHFLIHSPRQAEVVVVVEE